jgi:hypothetical protein
LLESGAKREQDAAELIGERRLSRLKEEVMPVYDTGLKIVAHASGRELAEVAGLSCSHWRPIVSEVQVTERFADRAFRATCHGDRCVVYFEAYTYWPKKALWNVLAKAGMLSEREQVPTVTVLYILRPRGYEDLTGELRLQVGGRPTQGLWYYPVPLWRQQPADWWEASPGLMALYPLTQHGRTAEQAVQHAAGAIRTAVTEANLQEEMLASLGYFSELVYPHLNVARLIGREEMRGSRFVREVFKEEFTEFARSAVQVALEERFGEQAAATLSAQLAAITDQKRLGRLHRLAIRCATLEDFGQELREGPAASRPNQPKKQRRKRE